eukprot:scaffold3987_cov134-Cylindrotheca_fusiformis.AAC.20
MRARHLKSRIRGDMMTHADLLANVGVGTVPSEPSQKNASRLTLHSIYAPLRVLCPLNLQKKSTSRLALHFIHTSSLFRPARFPSTTYRGCVVSEKLKM